MSRIFFIVGGLLFVAALLLVLAWRRKMNRLFDSLEDMLQHARDGSFLEEHFDERRLSKLEAELADFLGSSAISAQNVSKERDKIKTLISDISHQTKTPVANLLLYSELLEDAGLPEEQRTNAEAVHRQAEKLRFLIDSLVKLSRLENGILSFFPERADVLPMLQSIYEQMLPKAEKKGIRLMLTSIKSGENDVPVEKSISVRFTDTLEPMEGKENDMEEDGGSTEAFFDVKWTMEALLNIVDNAVKYTQEGSVSIGVQIYEMFVRIDVKDTGIGISEEELPRIFARFYRSQTVKGDEGVGIGLYLAREILSGEGGYIKAASVEGKGSTFSVFLPRRHT